MSTDGSDLEEDNGEAEETQPLHSLTEAFANFLLPAIHTILRLRNIYPATSFLLRRAYDFPVYQSRHPAVCAWICKAVSSVKQELVKGVVKRVALVIIHRQTLLPLERYVWDVSDWPGKEDVQSVKTEDVDAVRTEDVEAVKTEDIEAVESDGNEDASSTDEDAIIETDAKDQMRALLSRLVLCNDRLLAIPKGCTFTLAVELKSGKRAADLHVPTWVMCTSSQRSVDKASTKKDTTIPPQSASKSLRSCGSQVFALPAVESRDIVFEMWIEEGKGKLQALSKK